MKVRIKSWNELLKVGHETVAGNIEFSDVYFTRKMEELLPADRIIEINLDGEWSVDFKLYTIPEESYDMIPTTKEIHVPRFVSGDDYAFDVKDIAGLVFRPESISSRLGQMTVTFKSSRYQVVAVTKSEFDAAIKILKDWVEAKGNR